MYQQPQQYQQQPQQPYMGQPMMGQPMQQQPMMQPPMQQSYQPQPPQHAPVYTLQGFRNMPKKKKGICASICTCCIVIIIIIIAVAVYGSYVCSQLADEYSEEFKYSYADFAGGFDIKGYRGFFKVEEKAGVDSGYPEMLIHLKNNRDSDRPLTHDEPGSTGGSLKFHMEDGATWVNDCFTVEVTVYVAPGDTFYVPSGSKLDFSIQATTYEHPMLLNHVVLNNVEFRTNSGTARGNFEVTGSNKITSSANFETTFNSGSSLEVVTNLGNQRIEATAHGSYTLHMRTGTGTLDAYIADNANLVIEVGGSRNNVTVSAASGTCELGTHSDHDGPSFETYSLNRGSTYTGTIKYQTGSGASRVGSSRLLNVQECPS
ncbi:hypothetical protein P9112_008580 [Eukaryota sp. TZLM1-RC]